MVVYLVNFTCWYAINDTNHMTSTSFVSNSHKIDHILIALIACYNVYYSLMSQSIHDIFFQTFKTLRSHLLVCKSFMLTCPLHLSL